MITFTSALIAVLMSLGLLNSPTDLDTMTTTELDALEAIIIQDNIHEGYNDQS